MSSGWIRWAAATPVLLAGCTDLPVGTEGRMPLNLELRVPTEIVSLDTTLLTAEARDPLGNLVRLPPLAWDLEMEGPGGQVELVRMTQDSVWVVGTRPGAWTVEASVAPASPYFAGDPVALSVPVRYRGLHAQFTGVGSDTLLSALGEFDVEVRIRDYKDRIPGDGHGTQELVSRRGLIQGVYAGPATGSYRLTASAPGLDTLILTHTACEGLCGDTLVVTIEQVPVYLYLPPYGFRFASLNEEIGLGGEVLDGNAFPIEGSDVAWRLEDAADSVIIQLLDPSGRFLTRGNGTARVVATSGALEAVGEVHMYQEPYTIRLRSVPWLMVGPGTLDTIYVDSWDPGGSPIEPGGRYWNAEWTTLDPAVVDFHQEGPREAILLSVGLGETEIEVDTNHCGPVTCQENPDRTTVRVIPEPDSVRLGTDFGTTLQGVGPTGGYLFADVFLPGEVIPQANIRWESLDPAVATVEESGQVIAHAVGSAELVGWLGMAADTLVVTIVP